MSIIFARLLLVGLFCMGCSSLSGQWTIPFIPGAEPNAATNLNNNCFQITSGANTRGAVWNSTPIDLNFPFDITLYVNQSPWGADGIALVMQNTGLAAHGAGGNALGFGNSIPATVGYPGIAPSIAFELDTWDNTGAGVADIPQDHVAIHINGMMNAAIGAPIPALASSTDVTDGLCHTLRVTWNPATTNINIYFDADPVPRINLLYNMIAFVFAGNPIVWWGVTGSSGGAGMVQTVCVGANFAQAGPDRAICAGDTVRLAGSGGNTFAWSPGPPLLSSAVIPNPDFGPGAVGSYPIQLTVTNAALCTDVDNVTVTVEAIPTADPGAVTDVCLGDSALLGVAANPNWSYLWQPSTLLDNPNVAQPWLEPTTAGMLNYSLIVKDIVGTAACADTANISIMARDTPTVTATAVSDTICAGQNSTLTAIGAGGSGPYGYTWSNGPLTGSQIVSPVATTTYTVQVNDAFSCSSSTSVSVSVGMVPTANPGAVTAICLGDSVLLGVAANPNYAYQWQPATDLDDATAAQPWWKPTTAGMVNYTLIVTDTNGFAACADTALLSLTANDTPTVAVTAFNDTLCLGQSSLLTATPAGGNGPYAYLWSNGPLVNSQTVSPSVGTVYNVQVSDAFNCTTQGSIAIVVNDTPTVAALSTPDSICAGQSVMLSSTVTGGTPAYAYAWSTGGNTATSQVFLFASTPVILTITDTNGCTSTDSLFVTVSVVDSIDILSADTFVCLGGVVQITNTFGTSGVDVWTWLPSTGISNPTIPNPQINPTAPTVYYLSGFNGATGCGFTDSIVIGYSSLGPPNLDLGADTAICQGTSLMLQAGNAGYNYLWSDSSTGPSYLADTTGWVSVSIFDTIGCGYGANDSLYLLVNPLPQPDLGPDTTICPNDSLLLDGGVAANTYLWSNGDSTATIWGNAAAQYWLAVTDNNGCVGTDTMLLSMSPTYAITVSGLDSVYCLSDSSEQLSATPTGGTFSGAIAANGLFSPSWAGGGTHVISYQFIDTIGCLQIATLSTLVNLPPTVANAGTDIVSAGAVQLAANLPLVGSGMWTIIGGTGAQLSNAQDPVAALTGLPAGSCTLVWTIVNPPCPASADSVVVVVENVFLPTGFSPNDDGTNDSYVIRGITNFSDAKLSIFNRWGNLVWESAHYQNQWTGLNATGQPLVDDTYYAILEYDGKAVNTYIVLKR